MMSFFSLPYAGFLAACVFFYFIVWPLVVYFRDEKGLTCGSSLMESPLTKNLQA